jgi:hypothetical protein
LLPSYDAERRPIGARNVRMAAHFYSEHGKFGDELAAIDDDTPEGALVRERVGEALVHGIGAMFRTTGLQLGYRYEDSPICVSDGTPPYADDPEDVVPSTRPGSRAPHLWLGDDRSILDLFGEGLVLLQFGADAPDVSALEAAAQERGVPFKTISIRKPDAARLYERRLVLVRPDGHVAWRSDELPEDARAVIDRVRGAAT